ncbi:MAG: ABC transporter permease, partial [Bellilinea sp.]|nr:ABC transporter permease [Bellilinea sp.]
MPKSLVQIAVQTLIRRKWQSLLILLGVALGVAVMVSIDLANASASRAFELSTEVITGKATHQIVSSGTAIREEEYVRLRRAGVLRVAAPIVSEYVSIPAVKGQAFQLLGIDPFVDRAFRDYWTPDSFSGQAFYYLLTKPGAVMISSNLAERLGVDSGDEVSIEVAGKQQSVWIAGILMPEDRLAARSLEGVLLADIATVQEISGKIGYLDRIDLIITTANPAEVEKIEEQLPPELRIESVEARQGSIRQMTEAFQLNLSALSLLALVVGLFLIYNTMTFSVVQRRDLFGVMRSLGVTRREIFLLVSGEAFLIGLIGSGLGILLGILMGRNTVGMVSQTINDLYFTTTVQSVGIPIESLLKGGVVGVLATLGAAIPPALEAASVEPRLALSRSGLERKAKSAVWLLSGGGLLLVSAGYVVFQIPNHSLLFGFGGTFLVVVGLALFAPVLMKLFLGSIRPLFGNVFGFLGKMAPGNLLNSLSRTAVAVSALMVAVAVTIGVSLMIDSFRFTVTQWLEQTLQGDVYISVPGFNANSSLLPIDPSVLE